MLRFLESMKFKHNKNAKITIKKTKLFRTNKKHFLEYHLLFSDKDN